MNIQCFCLDHVLILWIELEVAGVINQKIKENNHSEFLTGRITARSSPKS
jgi:hypothetical protein